MNGSPLSRRDAIKLGAVTLTGLAGCLVRPANSNPEPAEQRPDPTDGATESELPGVADDCSPDTSAPEGPLTVDFDSRDRFRCRGRLFEDFSNLSYWDVLDGSLSGGESPYPGQSARLTASESESRAWITRRFEDGIDLSDWDLSMAVHPGSGEASVSNVRLQLLAPDRSNRLDMWRPLDPTDGWLRLDFGPTKEVGSPDLTDVRELRVQSWIGAERAAEFHVDEIRLTPKLDEGAVVVTFDDMSLSQYENAFPVMQEFGFPGVAGVIPRLVGNEGRINLAQLQALQDKGWDVVSYPQHETPLSEFVRSEQASMILDSKRWLADNGFESGSRFVLFPFGTVTKTTFDIAAQYHYLGLWSGRCPSGRLTGPLSVGRVNGADVGTTTQIVELAQKYRQVVPIMYQTVGEESRDHITAERFEETMRFVDDLGLRVLTTSDLWELQSLSD
ncbi:polysaccharide deacetylase family protein [Halomicroarcula sp. GCM10025324]|uniref:polysaccharide deacetylase family protein n=1 Tax=Haloarcula TaxID=2237 RepID=UPI0023E7A5A1|nr:polysaccharide deacetylase family protein [Halomicroarcula sp. ZS-22-S1]